MSLKEQVLAKAFSQLGYHERSDGWTKFGQWYTDTVLAGTGLDFSRSDWCVMFITWCMREAGVPDDLYPATSPQGSSVGYNLSWMEDKGYRTSADTMPEVGDLVYYHWSGSTSRYDHIGICVKVAGHNADDAVMTVIEGNYNDRVGEREIRYRDARVVATVTIPYDSPEESPADDDENKLYAPPVSFLDKQGARGKHVEILQKGLIGNGYDIVGGVDGYFGAETKKALVRYQADHGIIADGSFGDETVSTLLFG